MPLKQRRDRFLISALDATNTFNFSWNMIFENADLYEDFMPPFKTHLIEVQSFILINSPIEGTQIK